MSKVDLSTFLDQAKEQFQFLIDDYGFNLIADEEVNTSFIINYYKQGLFVFIRYGYYDDAFYFDVRKEVEGKPADNYGDEGNNWSFYDLIKLKRPEIKHKDLQPNYPKFEKALELNAKLIKETGFEILNGNSWPSR